MSDIYVVLVICLLIWGGIFFYLLHLDRLLKKIEQKVNFDEELEQK
ncbi:MAG: CcmD family protein [Calditrichia bacterium]|nr:CcmD family protein [Calditrichia bacterium]